MKTFDSEFSLFGRLSIIIYLPNNITKILTSVNFLWILLFV